MSPSRRSARQAALLKVRITAITVTGSDPALISKGCEGGVQFFGKLVKRSIWCDDGMGR